jgi:T4-like virus Myoviridae tail sheath stabiliser
MVASQAFFYDGQIERFLAQFIRIVSGFQVEYGQTSASGTAYQRVPVYYGDGSRQVAAIITQNTSPNSMPVVPAMTVHINNITYDKDRIQDPTYIGKMQIRERYYNEDTQEYENRQGNAFNVERPMPVPYTLELKLDIWTSNTKQKLQLLEQLMVLFNPAMEIQSTDNYIDWTSLSYVYLESPNWTSRTVPIGTDNPIDVATLTFKLPVWISPPARVTKLGVIQKIIASVYDSDGDLSIAILDSANLLGKRQYFTPLQYGVLLVNGMLTLLRYQNVETPRDIGGEAIDASPVQVGSPTDWQNFVNIYGQLTNGISEVRLTQSDGFTEVIGYVSYHPTDPTLLIFNVNTGTTPSNTLAPINAIINPTSNSLTVSVTQPTAGTRYLILGDIGSINNPNGAGPALWAGTDGTDLVAHANDIIQYTGTHWIVSFDSQNDTTLQYVSNLTTGIQYKWNLNQWVKSWEGEYKAGLWTLVL